MNQRYQDGERSYYLEGVVEWKRSPTTRNCHILYKKVLLGTTDPAPQEKVLLCVHSHTIVFVYGFEENLKTPEVLF